MAHSISDVWKITDGLYNKEDGKIINPESTLFEKELQLIKINIKEIENTDLFQLIKDKQITLQNDPEIISLVYQAWTSSNEIYDSLIEIVEESKNASTTGKTSTGIRTSLEPSFPY